MSLIVNLGELTNAVSGLMNDAAETLPRMFDPASPPLTPMEALGTADFGTSGLGAMATAVKTFADAAGNSGLAGRAGFLGAMANAATAASGFSKMTDAFLRNDSEQFAEGLLDLIGGGAGLLGLFPPFGPAALLVSAGALGEKTLLTSNPGEFKRTLNDLSRSFKDLSDKLSRDINDLYKEARSWAPKKDPLILDLDGDGIEATAIDRAAPVLFDHDADGIQAATGWIKADDGIVVLDLNGNGTIDTGRELFGDNTLLLSGEAATNGFQAIAQYDTNADGKINAADAIYTQLRMWQDANQDGVSQAHELKTLAELGIASINVVGQASNINLGNGNTQPWSGSYTRTNGTTGDSGTPELSGSLLLTSNCTSRTRTNMSNPRWRQVTVSTPQHTDWCL